MRSFVKRYKEEDGQTIVLAALAMSIFLFGAIGLAIDGAHMYAQRQMAQTAADAAATAGIMSIFDGTNGAGAAAFPTTGLITCSNSAPDPKTPCAYANKNGFGGIASDTVTVDFPPNSVAPGVNFSPTATDPVHLIRVSVTRTVSTTLMALLGTTVSTVNATAMAAIVDVIAPIPILVTHPTMAGSFSMNGTANIKICGGPSRSIQVNSGNAASNSANTNSTVDLSQAGPDDIKGACIGTGADFGYWGGPSSPVPFTLTQGANVHYLHASPVQDPLAGVAAPPIPSISGKQGPKIDAGTGICPAYAGTHGCTILTPGLYTANPALSNTTALMEPGIYYIQTGGFSCTANCNLVMAPSPVPDTTTGTGWDGTVDGGGVLIYNSGTGNIDIGSNGIVDLIGSPAAPRYQNILFFQDHSSPANTGSKAHQIGGGGALNLKGTIYLTNTLDNMTATTYQALFLKGNSGSGTLVQGQIIVDALSVGGTGGITMNLNSNSTLIVRQVALVN